MISNTDRSSALVLNFGFCKYNPITTETTNTKSGSIHHENYSTF